MMRFSTATHCSYCEQPFDHMKPGKCRTRDHIIPRVLMPSKRGNIEPACQTCNSLKGDKTPSALRAMADDMRERAILLDRMATKVEQLIEERGLL